MCAVLVVDGVLSLSSVCTTRERQKAKTYYSSVLVVADSSCAGAKKTYIPYIVLYLVLSVPCVHMLEGFSRKSFYLLFILFFIGHNL